MLCGPVCKTLASRFRSSSLIFEDARAEQGFLKSRDQNFATYTGATNAAWIFIGLLVWIQRRLEYNRGHQALANASEYLQSIVVAASVGLSALLVALCLASLLHRRRRFVSPAVFECFVMSLLCAMEVCVALSNPFFTARLFGEEIPVNSSITPEYQVDKDSFTMLLVYAVGVTIHAPQSARWAMLLPADMLLLCVSCVLLFSTPTADSTDLFSWAYKSSVYVFLLSICSYSKRVSEQRERADFTRIANEKRARCEAEFRLECMLSEGAKAKNETGTTETPPRAEEADVQTATSYSCVGFKRFDRMEVADDLNGIESSLQSIGNLGAMERWLLPGEEITIASESVILGHGAFGLVVEGFFFGAPVVIKAARHRHDASDFISTLRSLTHELRMLRRLKHPNIVSFFGASLSEDSRELVLVLERVEGIVLDELPSLQGTHHVQRCKILLDVASALHYLHEQDPSIVHGDLKASNVMVDFRADRPLAKLIDFGLSRLLRGRSRSMGGTLRWMAPEIVVCSSCPPSTAADVFSFGRLMYFILTGRKPLANMSQMDIERSTAKKEVPPLDWPPLSPLLELSKATIDACISVQPKQRPAMAIVHFEAWQWLIVACGEEEVSDHTFDGLAGLISTQEDFVKGLDALRCQIDLRDAAGPEANATAAADREAFSPWERPAAIHTVAGASTIAL